VFVSLIGTVPYILITQSGPRRYSDAHRGYDDAGRPEVVISAGSNILHDYFRREVVRCPTHRLLGRDSKLYFAQPNDGKRNAP